MDSVVYTPRPGEDTLEDMPRHIRNCAVMFEVVQIELTPAEALSVARALERGLNPPPAAPPFWRSDAVLWVGIALSFAAMIVLAIYGGSK